MKKVRMVLLAGLLLAALCAPAYAWEFAMSGNFQWTYEYHAQGGTNGFFGPQNVINANLAAFNPIANWSATNFWVGSRLMDGTQYGLVTGLDASINYQRMVLNPEIRVNPAVRIRGQYWIGGFGPYDGGGPGTLMTTRGQYASSFYLNQQTGSVITAPLAIGQWNLLWVTAQTPWGILVFGKRGAPFGMGLLNDEGERSVVSESLAIVAPYGPLRIGIFAYPWRQGVLLDNQRNMTATGLPQLGQVASNTQGTLYPKLWDASNIRLSTPQMGAFVTYSNGPLDAGIVYLQWQQHQGQEVRTLATGVAGIGATLPTIDANTEGGNAYVKYNNGRFFFNAELAWDRWDNRFQLPLIPLFDPLTGLGLGDIYQPVFTEDWNVGTEFGFLCGPSKLSFLYAYLSGMDRRNGIWISKQSFSNLVWGLVSCNQALFLPYSYLMGYTYASGLNTRNGLGEGGFTDASVVASRLDYAVAANLNWYGSFIWAWRNGLWPWGTLTVNGANTAGNAVQVNGFPAVAGNSAAPQNAGAVRAPNIPDNNLGWELTTGVDWKLLEGLTTNLRLAYWQPGEWFKFACLDRSVASTTVNAAGNLVPVAAAPGDFTGQFGVNPSKSIDPIWAFSGQLNVDF